MKILIIDDNTDIRMLLEMTINAMGHEFNSTPSGLEGLEMIKGEIY
ncbi:MAG: response regulator, partial [Cenarchaeum sp. SB0669_bin_11]|nr:response regulator [Cenarchaeum sp. SB0669_bin_11]